MGRVWHDRRCRAEWLCALRQKSRIIRPDVRHPRVVALVALTAAIAAVAVPGPVGSRNPSPALETDPDLSRKSRSRLQSRDR